MARPLRLQLPGAYYHILARGNARQDIYLDDQDRREFLSLLGESALRHGILAHAYCMRRNHYHLIIETVRPELSDAIRRINGLYSQYFNRRHERVGHLFQGRFKSILIDTDAYFLSAHRYIHRNPVRKGLVKLAHQYEWSSCREFVQLRTAPPWLKTETALSHFLNKPEGQHAAYAAFLAMPGDANPFFDAYAQTFLGSRSFVESMRQRAKAIAKPEHAGHRRFQDRMAPGTIGTAVDQQISIQPLDVAGWRQADRAIRIYLLRERARLSLKELAEQFQITPSAACHQVTKVKTRLAQDAEFARLMMGIEGHLAGLIQVSRPDPRL